MGVAIYSQEFKTERLNRSSKAGIPFGKLPHGSAFEQVDLHMAQGSRREIPGLQARRKRRSPSSRKYPTQSRAQTHQRRARYFAKSRRVLCQGIRVRYAFIRDHRNEFSVAAQCRVLRVHRSGFYLWLKNPSSTRAKEDDKLVSMIKAAHEESSGTYGSPRICREIRESGALCGENRVARLMKEHGIRPRGGIDGQISISRPSLVTPNRLNQDFNVPGPDRVWVTDITYIATSEGWLYLAVVIDLFSRRVVGWSMSSTITTDLAITALNGALWRRRPNHRVTVHSDQGSQFSSDAWNRFCRDHKLDRSMSRRGNCYDNAVVESFFSSLKKERVRGRTYLTREEARADIFDYIEAFYNRSRRHSKLGMLSPVEFEEVKIGI